MIGDLVGCLQQAADCMQQSLADELYHANEASAALQQLQGVRAALGSLLDVGGAAGLGHQGMGGVEGEHEGLKALPEGETGEKNDPEGQNLHGRSTGDQALPLEEQQMTQQAAQAVEKEDSYEEGRQQGNGEVQQQQEIGGSSAAACRQKQQQKQMKTKLQQEARVNKADISAGDASSAESPAELHGEQQEHLNASKHADSPQQQQQQDDAREEARDREQKLSSQTGSDSQLLTKQPPHGTEANEQCLLLQPAQLRERLAPQAALQPSVAADNDGGGTTGAAHGNTSAGPGGPGKAVVASFPRRTRTTTLGAVPIGEGDAVPSDAGLRHERDVQQQQPGTGPGLKASVGLGVADSSDKVAEGPGRSGGSAARRGGRCIASVGGRGKQAGEWSRGQSRRVGRALSPITEATSAGDREQVCLPGELKSTSAAAVIGSDAALIGNKRSRRGIAPGAKRAKGRVAAVVTLSTVQEAAAEEDVAGEEELNQCGHQAAVAAGCAEKGEAEGVEAGEGAADVEDSNGVAGGGPDPSDTAAAVIPAVRGRGPKQRLRAAKKAHVLRGAGEALTGATSGEAKIAAVGGNRGNKQTSSSDQGEDGEWRLAEDVLRELVGNAGGGSLPVAEGRRATFAIGTKCGSGSSGEVRAVRRGRQTGARVAEQGLGMVQEDEESSGQTAEGVLDRGRAGEAKKGPAAAKRPKRASWGGEGDAEQVMYKAVCLGPNTRQRDGVRRTTTSVGMRTRHRHLV
jgi:hypothetical protein